MPIKFRCAYCNQLMGISRRKAGTVVSCPTCKGQIVVPLPEPAIHVQPLMVPAAVVSPIPATAEGPIPGAPQNVFENQNFDANLFVPSKNSPINPSTGPIGPDLGFDVTREPLPPIAQAPAKNAPPNGHSPAALWMLVGGGVALAAVAFGLGYWVAKTF
jgi:DNA-directed RNA polymerase subunit RPC12/RpoP